MAKLAIDGGPKVRETPFPGRKPFGEREEELLLQAVRGQNLFGKNGKLIPEFEKQFAAFYGAGYAQSATSGTASIHLAVGAVNPDPGDEIITAPITDPGSVMPILYQNAIPVFADVDPLTLNMTPESIEACITDRTRAIILVHLFGRPCDVDEVVRIAKKHDVVLIEDCSQAHATKYNGRYVGTSGHMGCFSLQQSKHMTTGDGGMVITDDEQTYIRLKLFADKGWDYQYMGERDHGFLAPCYRTTELMGAVGLAQLDKVRDVMERRIELGGLLCDLIADAFCKNVSAEGVQVGAHYIKDPIYLLGDYLTGQKTYGKSGCPFTCGVTSREYHYGPELVPNAVEGLRTVAVRGIHEHMEEADIRDMAEAVNKVASAMQARCVADGGERLLSSSGH